eukprot:jgi/Psemu1/327301/estExt_fgenesh1_pg.C_6120002
MFTLSFTEVLGQLCVTGTRLRLSNTAAQIFEKGCRDEGNQLFAADGIEGTTTGADTPGQATLSFSLKPIILKNNNNVFTSIPEEAKATMEFCTRFMLQTDDGSIEVNYLESIVTLIFSLTAGFELEGFTVTSKEKIRGANATARSYGVEGYLCDPSYPSVKLTSETFVQGSVISVCVTPAQEAIDDGLSMRSIDEFAWRQDFIEQPAISTGTVSSNQLTSLTCTELSLYCSFSSVLYADFYKPPTKPPSSSPTAVHSEFPTFSTDSTPTTFPPSVYVTQSECEKTAQLVETNLNFFESTVKQADIQYGGELRYGNIGTINGQEVDLLITATNYSQPEYTGNGKDPTETFGEISVMAVQGDTEASEGNFEVCFVEPDTYTKVTANSFQWSIFDLDNHVGVYGIRERVIINISQAESFSLWPNADETELFQYCENDSSMSLPCDEGVRTVFEATSEGYGKDNPTNPNSLTDQQKMRSVLFTFANTACFNFTFSVYCPFEPETQCSKYIGRRLLFSGGADQIVEEGVTNCEPARRNLEEFPRSDRTLVEADVEKAIVAGYGTATLMFDNRRKLSSNGRILQTNDGAKSDISLVVDIITSDDATSRLRTSGGTSAWGSCAMVFSGLLVFLAPFLWI